MASARRYRRLAKGPARAVPGYGRDEIGDVFGFLALVEQRGHLAQPTGPAFHDRVFDQ